MKQVIYLVIIVPHHRMRLSILSAVYIRMKQHKNKMFILFVLLFMNSLLSVFTHYGNLCAEDMEEKYRILVVPMKAKGGITQNNASLLTDLLTVILHRTNRFSILNREDMEALLTEKEFEMAIGCDDNICLLANVEKLAVNKVIAGSIGSVGEKYYISIRLIDENGKNEIMEEDRCECTLEELDESIERIASKFLSYLGEEVVKYEKGGFIFIKRGNFEIGDMSGVGEADESVYNVYLKDFYICDHEVTNQEFKKFLDETGYITGAEKSGRGYALRKVGRKNWGWLDGSSWKKPFHPGDNALNRLDHPVVQVSYHDAVAYCKWRTKKEGKLFRLPTEAEWEYVARNGDERIKHDKGNRRHGKSNFIGVISNDLWDFTSPVKSFRPNNLGIYDMSGNVWEWCSDRYFESTYAKTYSNDSEKSDDKTQKRVVRGGSWCNNSNSGRPSNRAFFYSNFCSSNIGFRCVMVP
ncbi:MAG: hypothetical protein CL471_04460 [Acidobacteria bacterium]|nr:hypothetical protein [Acidobacteriota bacterium]